MAVAPVRSACSWCAPEYLIEHCCANLLGPSDLGIGPYSKTIGPYQAFYRSAMGRSSLAAADSVHLAAYQALRYQSISTFSVQLGNAVQQSIELPAPGRRTGQGGGYGGTPGE